MAEKRDFYEVLGVSKSATKDEIKSAYRKLAKVYHPDNKQTGDEAKFKEIQEAYDILYDDQKRQTYDQFGHAAFDQSAGGGHPEKIHRVRPLCRQNVHAGRQLQAADAEPGAGRDRLLSL